MTLPDTQLYIILALSVTMVSILGVFTRSNTELRKMRLFAVTWLFLFLSALLSWLQVIAASWIRDGLAQLWHSITLLLIGISVLLLLVLLAAIGRSIKQPRTFTMKEVEVGRAR